MPVAPARYRITSRAAGAIDPWTARFAGPALTSPAMDLPCVWDAPRPYVHPLTTPSGAVLTVEAPADHPWHHALWFTIKFVNGENFWEEYGEFGTLRTIAVGGTDDGIRATIDWVAPDGESVRLNEVRTIRAIQLDESSYAIDWNERLTMPINTVLDRTPFTTWGGYGGLTFRGAPDFTDTVIRLADGTDRDRALGDPSPWLSIEGTPHTWSEESQPTEHTQDTPEPQRSGGEQVGSIPTKHASTDTERTTRNDGEEQAGVLFFDHPDNPRSPSPWYASTKADTYGEGWANFVNAAFLWNEPLNVAANEDLHLSYRVIVHDGHWDTDRINAEYARWIG